MEAQQVRTAAPAVPFVDLGKIHDRLRAALFKDISELIDSGAFVNGPQVEWFERAFAKYCGTANAVGVANGLDGLRLALLADGIEPGDEVIVPAHTFVATFEAVTQAGGRTVVVDISEDDYNIDPRAVEAEMSSRTRFLLPVHLYGQMADMRGLRGLAAAQGLRIIEDACQAHGAERDGLRAGAGGEAGVFSFYPTKNLGAMGDAGAVVTDDSEIAARIRMLREHGQSTKYTHQVEGYTSRLDTIQALVLLRKLPLLDKWNEARRTAARSYMDALEGVGDLRLPPVPDSSAPAWHLFVVRTAAPEPLSNFLAERGIATGRHYPEPPHLCPAYARLGYRAGDFPIAESLAREGLSLPIFPGISEEQIATVAASMRAYFARG
jgi:dTDP-3-amino-3,4,6-trideoxy-alpha-D-glucose transaminase